MDKGLIRLSQIPIEGNDISEAVAVCERMMSRAEMMGDSRCVDCRDTRWIETTRGMRRCEQCREIVKQQLVNEKATILEDL